jgi:proteasome lid subunit RPN8/RPN11
MAQGKKDSKQQPKKSGETKDSTPEASDAAVSVSEWMDRKRPARRTFPGPRMTDVALRVALEREPFADLVAHAKESLDKEICGVLVGDVCEDDEGEFLHVKAIIRGLAAKQASTHVTYTQETWNKIHEAMESRHPKMQIIGWYHSHPGYGVEFSEMDVFIQKNFFSSPNQIGLVTDPLGGHLGVCINADEGIKYIGQVWVDGREQRCVVPAQQKKTSASESKPAALADDRLESVENRLNQALRALDDLRNTIHRFVLFTGMLVGVGVIMAIGYFIYSNYVNRMSPPELRNFAPVPVKIGDKVVLIGVGVVSWEVPPELLPKIEQGEQPSDNQAQPQDGTGSPQPGQ